MKYTHYSVTEITKEILDTIKTGDLIRVNNWKKPMRVVAVSENFFVMIEKNFGNTSYSVFSKRHWQGVCHNNLVGGHYYCGADAYLFGYGNMDYSFKNTELNKKYLQSFENGESRISERNGISIYALYIKTK